MGIRGWGLGIGDGDWGLGVGVVVFGVEGFRLRVHSVVQGFEFEFFGFPICELATSLLDLWARRPSTAQRTPKQPHDSVSSNRREQARFRSKVDKFVPQA